MSSERKSDHSNGSDVFLPLSARKLVRPRLAHGVRAGVLSLCALALITSSGCAWWRSVTGQEPDPESLADIEPTTVPATTQQTSESVTGLPQNLQSTAFAVVKGPLPLTYLVESDGAIRVRNIDSGEEIITFDAKAMQIVRVETTGVRLANKPVIGATLLPGNYAIERINPDGNTVRSTQTRQGVSQSP